MGLIRQRTVEPNNIIRCDTVWYCQGDTAVGPNKKICKGQGCQRDHCMVEYLSIAKLCTIANVYLKVSIGQDWELYSTEVKGTISTEWYGTMTDMSKTITM